MSLRTNKRRDPVAVSTTSSVPLGHASAAVPTLFDSLPLSAVVAARALQEIRQSVAKSSSMLLPSVASSATPAVVAPSDGASPATPTANSSRTPSAAARRVTFGDVSSVAAAAADALSSPARNEQVEGLREDADDDVSAVASPAEVAALRAKAAAATLLNSSSDGANASPPPNTFPLLDPPSLRQKHLPLFFDCVLKHSRRNWQQERFLLLGADALSLYHLDGILSRTVLLSDVVEALVLMPFESGGGRRPAVNAFHSDPAQQQQQQQQNDRAGFEQGSEMMTTTPAQARKRRNSVAAASVTAAAAAAASSDADAKRGRDSIVLRCRAIVRQEAGATLLQAQLATAAASAAPAPDATPSAAAKPLDAEAAAAASVVDAGAGAAKPQGSDAVAAAAAPPAAESAKAAPAAKPTSSNGTLLFDLRFECSTDKAQHQLLGTLQKRGIPIVRVQLEASKTFSLAKILGFSPSASSSAAATAVAPPPVGDAASSAASAAAAGPHAGSSPLSLAGIFLSERSGPGSSSPPRPQQPLAPAPVTLSEDAAVFQLVPPPRYAEVRNGEIAAARTMVVTEYAGRSPFAAGLLDGSDESAMRRARRRFSSAQQVFSECDPTLLPPERQLAVGPFLEPAAAAARRKSELAGVPGGVSFLARHEPPQLRKLQQQPQVQVQRRLVAAPLLWDSVALLPRVAFKHDESTSSMSFHGALLAAAARQRMIIAQREKAAAVAASRAGDDALLMMLGGGSEQTLRFPSWKQARRLIHDALADQRSAAAAAAAVGSSSGSRRRALSSASSSYADRVAGRSARTADSLFDFEDTGSNVSSSGGLSASTATTNAAGGIGGFFADNNSAIEQAATSAQSVFPAAISFMTNAALTKQQQLLRQQMGVQQRSPGSATAAAAAASTTAASPPLIEEQDEWSALKQALLQNSGGGGSFAAMQPQHSSNGSLAVSRSQHQFGTPLRAPPSAAGEPAAAAAVNLFGGFSFAGNSFALNSFAAASVGGSATVDLAARIHSHAAQQIVNSGSSFASAGAAGIVARAAAPSPLAASSSPTSGVPLAHQQKVTHHVANRRDLLR